MTTYLNHAGTSWPKPAAVRAAVARTLDGSATDWPSQFPAAHHAVARWLGVADADRLLLTPGCTSALAAAVEDLPWETGDRVLCGSFEHQALARPLSKLVRDRGVELVPIPPSQESAFDLDVLERELAKGARLVATAWATNITGEIVPLESIVERAHASGALVLVDAAQAAGWLPIDVAALGIDMLAFAGHKGPQAPWGVGGLYVAPHVEMACSGALCTIDEAPTRMPGYCDTGSVDRAALAGLVAGIEWLNDRPNRLRDGRGAIERLKAALPADQVRFYGAGIKDRVPTLAFTHHAIDAQTLAASLRSRGVIAAGGFMCAPQAHQTLGTEEHGVVRISVGPATTEQDLVHAEAALNAACRALS